MSTTDATSTLFDAQPDGETDDITETLVLGNSTVIIGRDPFSPIDADKVDCGAHDNYVADSEIVKY